MSASTMNRLSVPQHKESYVVMVVAAFVILQAAVTSTNYYKRYNNWVVGSAHSLSRTEELLSDAALEVACGYLRALVDSNYEETYRRTLPDMRPSYPEFSREQDMIRAVYFVRKRYRAVFCDGPSLGKTLKVATNTSPSAIRSAILRIPQARRQQQSVRTCSWPSKVVLLHDTRGSGLWLILGREDGQWMMVCVLRSDPRSN